MFEAPSSRPGRRCENSRRRLARGQCKPGLEQLERRELLDTGLSSVAGLTDPAATQLVTGLYYDLLHRAPEPSEVGAWVATLGAGRSAEDVARGFVSSPEYRADFITDNYTAVLRREPTPGEGSGWQQPMAAGLREERPTAPLRA